MCWVIFFLRVQPTYNIDLVMYSSSYMLKLDIIFKMTWYAVSGPLPAHPDYIVMAIVDQQLG